MQTRNALAIYDLPRHRLIHHLLPRVPLRTSSLRGLGAWANVFAIELFIDELAGAGRRRPVSLPAVAPLRPARAPRDRDRRADERLVREPPAPRRHGSSGFGFARYKNIASFAAVVAEVEVDEAVQLPRFGAARMQAW